jgi:hypothetical protein
MNKKLAIVIVAVMLTVLAGLVVANSLITKSVGATKAVFTEIR